MLKSNIETQRLILKNFELNDAEKFFWNFGKDISTGRYIAGFPVNNIEFL